MPRTVGTPARSEFSSCTGSGDDLSGSWWARVVSAEAWKEGDLRSNAAHGGDTGAIRAWKEGDLRSNAAHGGVPLRFASGIINTGAIRVQRRGKRETFGQMPRTVGTPARSERGKRETFGQMPRTVRTPARSECRGVERGRPSVKCRARWGPTPLRFGDNKHRRDQSVERGRPSVKCRARWGHRRDRRLGFSSCTGSGDDLSG